MERPHLLPLVAFAVAAVVAAVWWRGGRSRPSAPVSTSSAPGVARPDASTSPGAPASVRASRRSRAVAVPPPRATLGALARDVAATDAAEHEALVAAAERRWKQAEQAATAEAWDLAADAHARAVAVCGAGPRCIEEAFAEVLARSNARRIDADELPPGDDPVPLPERVETMIDAIDRYLEIAPESEDAAAMRFIAASALWRHRHFDDDTIRRLESLVFAAVVTEVTEYATNQLVDLYMRNHRHAELRQLVDRLLTAPDRLARFPELLERLHDVRATL